MRVLVAHIYKFLYLHILRGIFQILNERLSKKGNLSRKKDLKKGSEVDKKGTEKG